jgi:hypothetical protein
LKKDSEGENDDRMEGGYEKESRCYLSLPFLMMSTISRVVTFALMVGTSKGEEAVFSGTSENVRPSFLRIKTLPVFSACLRTIASFCRASE